jgi:hypothetical protein
VASLCTRLYSSLYERFNSSDLATWWEVRCTRGATMGPVRTEVLEPVTVPLAAEPTMVVVLDLPPPDCALPLALAGGVFVVAVFVAAASAAAASDAEAAWRAFHWRRAFFHVPAPPASLEHSCHA